MEDRPLGAIAELVKEGSLLHKLLGPTLAEVGLWSGAELRYLRLKRTKKLLEKTEALTSGRTVGPVSLKLLAPIIEGSSLEDDTYEDFLLSKWAGLLASAAVGEPVHPSYVKIMAELTAAEVKVLDWLYPRFDSSKPEHFLLMHLPETELQKISELPAHEFDTVLENLFRLRLCLPLGKRTLGDENEPFDTDPPTGLVGGTYLGAAFVKACRGPDPVISS